jgi:hypothetical protein
MSEARQPDPNVNEADYETAVIECFNRIDRIREKMAEDQNEIDRLKAETREILKRLEAA